MRPLQHVAFQCDTFEDLLGTYARLMSVGTDLRDCSLLASSAQAAKR
jgi:hypothetical protein